MPTSGYILVSYKAVLAVEGDVVRCSSQDTILCSKVSVQRLREIRKKLVVAEKQEHQIFNPCVEK